MKNQIEAGQVKTLQKCKHSWLNGLLCRVAEVRDADTFVVVSEQGRHIVGKRNLQ